MLIELLFQFAACQVCVCEEGGLVGVRAYGICSGRGTREECEMSRLKRCICENLQHLSVTLIKAEGDEA